MMHDAGSEGETFYRERCQKCFITPATDMSDGAAFQRDFESIRKDAGGGDTRELSGKVYSRIMSMKTDDHKETLIPAYRYTL